MSKLLDSEVNLTGFVYTHHLPLQSVSDAGLPLDTRAPLRLIVIEGGGFDSRRIDETYEGFLAAQCIVSAMTAFCACRRFSASS